jgi:hypothetical protein
MHDRAVAAVERPLPGLADVLGAEPTLRASPVFVISRFDNTGDTGDSDWGAAVGWALMNSISGQFGELAVIPPYQSAEDAATRGGAALTGSAALSLSAKRTGAGFGLSGSIRVVDSRFEFRMDLFEFPANHVKLSTTKIGVLSALPEALQAAAQELIEQAVLDSSGQRSSGKVLTPRLSELTALSRAFAKQSTYSARELAERYATLSRENEASASLNLLYLQALNSLADQRRMSAAVQTKMPTARQRQEPAEIYSRLLRSQYNHAGIDASSILYLSKTILENPNNIGAWFALTDAYNSENVMYQDDERGGTYVISAAIDHHLGTANAITIALETLRRWPDHYRSWSTLATSLAVYAGLVRGTAYWNEIPEDARTRYRAIMEVVEDCLRTAIRKHPDRGELHRAMIDHDLRAGRDWMDSFRVAAQLTPHSKRLYQTAFNYARPQWGGTKDQLKEIYATSVKNNPGETWPQMLREEWAPEIVPWIDLEKPLVRYTLIFVGLVLFVIVWQVRKQRRS